MSMGGTGAILSGSRISYRHERACVPQRRCLWIIASLGGGTMGGLPFPDTCNGLFLLHLLTAGGRERFCAASDVVNVAERPSDTRAGPGKAHHCPCRHLALVRLGAAAFWRARHAA